MYSLATLSRSRWYKVHASEWGVLFAVVIRYDMEVHIRHLVAQQYSFYLPSDSNQTRPKPGYSRS